MVFFLHSSVGDKLLNNFCGYFDLRVTKNNGVNYVPNYSRPKLTNCL